MESKAHTPGPWMPDLAPDARSRGYVRTENRLAVARATSTGRGYSETLANAQLIAAAPELLAALRANIEGRVRMSINACHPSKRFCDICGTNSEKVVHSPNCPVNLAEIAIAKAEGRE